jgi:hypothetical protein
MGEERQDLTTDQESWHQLESSSNSIQNIDP